MRKREINPGDKFSQLTVIEEVPQRYSGRYFKCRCDCGNVKEILEREIIENNRQMDNKKSNKHIEPGRR